MQVLNTKKCGDSEPSCPYKGAEFGHAVEESHNEDIANSVSEQGQLRLPGHKMDGFGNDSGRCLGHQTTEPSTIAGNSPTQAKPEANLADDSSNYYQPGTDSTGESATPAIPSGSGVYVAGGKSAIAAMFPPGTALCASSGRKAIAVEGHP